MHRCDAFKVSIQLHMVPAVYTQHPDRRDRKRLGIELVLKKKLVDRAMIRQQGLFLNNNNNNNNPSLLGLNG